MQILSCFKKNITHINKNISKFIKSCFTLSQNVFTTKMRLITLCGELKVQSVFDHLNSISQTLDA